MITENFKPGTPVRVNLHRENWYTLGTVKEYHADSNNYEIEITGGVDITSKPAKVGKVIFRVANLVEAIPNE